MKLHMHVPKKVRLGLIFSILLGTSHMLVYINNSSEKQPELLTIKFEVAEQQIFTHEKCWNEVFQLRA